MTTERLTPIVQGILTVLEVAKEDGMLESELYWHLANDLGDSSERGKRTKFGQALALLSKEGKVLCITSIDTDLEALWFLKGYDPQTLVATLMDTIEKLKRETLGSGTSRSAIVFAESSEKFPLPEYIQSRRPFKVSVEACPPDYLRDDVVAIAIRRPTDRQPEMLLCDGRMVKISKGPGVPLYDEYQTVYTGLSEIFLFVKGREKPVYTTTGQSDPITIALVGE